MNLNFLKLGCSLFLITGSVFAAPEVQDAVQSGKNSMIMLAVFVFIFYMFILRPQSKQTKEHRSLISRIEKGDEIVTTGGILAKVEQTTDRYLICTISENTEIIIQRQAVTLVLPKGTLKTIK